MSEHAPQRGLSSFADQCDALIREMQEQDLDEELPRTVEHLRTLSELARLGGLNPAGLAHAQRSFAEQKRSIEMEDA